MKHSYRQVDTKKNKNRAEHFQDKKFSFRPYLPLYVLLFIVFLMESLFLTIHREINLDEGWYLYASRLVYEGKMLYKDFAYTQGPVFPYIYGIFQQIFGTSIYVGRVTAMFFGLLSLFIACLIAFFIGGNSAVLITLALVMTTIFLIVQFSFVVTYSLASFFLMSSILIMLLKMKEQYKIFLSIFLLCCAIGVRLSILPVLPILILIITLKSEKRMQAFVLSVITCLVSLSLIFLPFYLSAPEQVVYDLFKFHIISLPFSSRLYSLFTLILNNIVDFPFAIMAFFFSLIVLFNKRPVSIKTEFIPILLALSIPVIFILHLLPFGAGSYYNTLLVLPVAIFTGWAISRIWEQMKNMPRKPFLIMVITVVFLNLMGQVDILIRYQLVLFRHGDSFYLEKPLQEIEEAAEIVKQNTTKESKILTLQTYIVVEADRSVMSGYEMSIFASHPFWDTATCRAFSRINKEIVQEQILKKFPEMIIIAGEDFNSLNISADEFNKWLGTNYSLLRKFDNFGQFNSTLFILKRVEP